MVPRYVAFPEFSEVREVSGFAIEEDIDVCL